MTATTDHLAAVRAALAVNPSHPMAPSIAAVCDELERLRGDHAALRQELAEEQASRARLDEHYLAVCQQRDTTSRVNETVRKKLARATRLGLGACEAAKGMTDLSREAGGDDEIAAIRTALEAL